MAGIRPWNVERAFHVDWKEFFIQAAGEQPVKLDPKMAFELSLRSKDFRSYTEQQVRGNWSVTEVSEDDFPLWKVTFEDGHVVELQRDSMEDLIEYQELLLSDSKPV